MASHAPFRPETRTPDADRRPGLGTGRTEPVPPSVPVPSLRAVRSVRHLGPQWYASVMGTAVVATAGAALPLPVPGLRTAAGLVWALSLLMLTVLVAARAVHHVRHRDQARAHLLDPATAPFHGCAAMALLSVGGGALSVGRDWIGLRAAVALDAVLFSAGTLLGLVTAVAVPYLMVVHHRIEGASPAWLLPVVPPMVSAAQGPLLLPHLPAGQARETLLLGCYALFGVSLFATLLVLPLVFGRLVTGGPPPSPLTPSLFLVLGPLGQSVTSAGHFADTAGGVLPAAYAHGFTAFAVLYGVPVMGFALLWLALAGALVVRARRRGMGFTLSWWAFTFPVGTCVTGAEALARHTGLAGFRWVAAGLYALLVAAWLVAAVRTAGGLVSGVLLAGPGTAPGALRPGTARTR
ncbi:TDT family transporter [Streptomyces gulbargensis]|uniref:TDT family transporter n=2 Tax=Streptomyces gulbargensis TaxID=364901 RepID=A0ABP7M8G9_9ACTN